ncbi:hypothetical protein JWG45_13255 [Leptospira sp. 201903070]|uniref:Uncharacterized protein n=1 Tax=Leptospira ainlahdjerensis TaxID=2810033 RepID=A0ABS2UCP4_9LEPT|nr:hypothetical protein [Leptospira ainlahdjerensis]MBM9578118.1 hypothetical protein [Leptospira ainlahdjerensis]
MTVPLFTALYLSKMNQDIDLFIRKSILDPFQKRLRIDSKTIQFGEVQLRFHEIKEIKYGITQLYINGIKANRLYSIGLRDGKNRSIQIGFQSIQLFVTNKKMENRYLQIIDSLWENRTKKLAEEALENLENGRSYKIQNLEVTPKGVNIHIVKWFQKNEDHFVEWKDLRKYSQEGHLFLYSDLNPKIKTKINFQTVWNAPVIASVLETLWQDGRAYALSSSHDRY